MTDCIFCKIRDGEMPGFKFYENEHVFALMDIFPAHKGHCLIIPQNHHENIFDLPEDVAGEILKASKIVADAIKKTLKCDGMNFVQSNGKVAGQEVMHYHMHIVPRFESENAPGAMNAFHPKGYDYSPTKEEIGGVMEEIKKGL